MSETRPRVVVIGGGLGGLCLAEGLHRAGIPVTVHERDASPAARRQGYRIHLGDVGATALADCLPRASYELLLATAGRPGGQVTVASKRLRRLRVIPGGTSAQVNVPVNRLTVREIMLADLGDVVRFSAGFTHYEPEGDGVRAHFADGDSVFADVLVGADGVGSRVRGQLLPEATVRDTGNRVIYGKTLLDDVTRKLLPADVRHGFLAVRAIPRPIGLALGLVEFTEPVGEAAKRSGVPLTPTEDYLMFALSAPRKSFPCPDAEMSTMDGGALRTVVLGMTKRWHPDLRELLARCVIEENFYLPIRVSDPIPPWPTGPVTLLGDAAHAMSPAGGSGANIALRDAALLARQLKATTDDRRALIGEYERQMLDYGFAAVRASLT